MFVSLPVSIDSMIMSLLLEVLTVTGDLASAGTAICFETLVAAYLCSSWLNNLWDNMLDILDWSLSFLQIIFGAECISMIFLCIKKTTLMQGSMWVVRSKMLTAKFSTTSNHVRTCMDPILKTNEMITSTLINASVVDWGFSPSRRSKCNLQRGLWLASLIRSGPAPV